MAKLNKVARTVKNAPCNAGRDKSAVARRTELIRRLQAMAARPQKDLVCTRQHATKRQRLRALPVGRASPGRHRMPLTVESSTCKCTGAKKRPLLVANV